VATGPQEPSLLTYAGGSCEKTSKYLSVNIGTVVLGQTTKPKPNYFGLDVGQVPGSTVKPAPKDGIHTGVVLALVHGGTTYVPSSAGKARSPASSSARLGHRPHLFHDVLRQLQDA
jgi:hypothetical protein